MTVFAFTCTGPYAILILSGIKRTENRSVWPVPSEGRAAISCSKSFCKEEYGQFIAWASAHLPPEDFEKIPAWCEVKDWPGKIVGVCDYKARRRAQAELWDEGYDCWWDLSNVVRLPDLIPCRGNVGMWQMPAGLAAKVSAADDFLRLRIETADDAYPLFRAAIPIAKDYEGFFVLPIDKERRPICKPILVSLGHIRGTTAVEFRKVFIIENQLESTNHDHLGKLITYASGKSADIIVWVVKHAREEHRSAIEWLNIHTDDSVAFFLCEIKLYKIGNSSPAVKFEVIERPNDWAKDVKKATTTSAVQQRRFDYWVAFQNYAFQDSAFAREFNRRKPTLDHWMTFSIGSSSCHLALLQLHKRQSLAVEFYIGNDKDLFHLLYGHRQEIEADCGLKLDWRELPHRKASRILFEKKFELSNTNQWNAQFAWVVDVMLKMKKAFKKFI